ncbi:unnamed protein product [Medioppia subpectinata]|uniref:BUD13 homolog n=1 Tax=Medioppia subpectinata TaxID=1979941 RepID=A0A7R9L0R4_9ACAR|nr:unnamed protein product [Medioppia subpectinata]CAG2113026.1 unnamed protein product [Medioppia subpectinata]
MSKKSYDRPLEHNEYLKLKYLSPNESQEVKRKKSKMKKILKPKNRKIRIFDDDIDLKNIEANDSEEELQFATKEEKPIVAGVVDDRPLHMRRKDIDTNRWKTVVDPNVEEFDNNLNESKGKRRDHSDSDLSPLRTKKSTKGDSKANSRHSGNLSPKRRRHDSDSDLSPVRSTSELRANARTIDNNRDRDLSPKRRRHDTDSDLSPERETNPRDRTNSRHHSRDLSPTRNRSPKRQYSNKTSDSVRHDSDSDLSPPRTHNKKGKTKPEKTLSGKKAGLSDGKHLREELMATKRREQKLFDSISDEVLGKNAKTVFRDSKSGRIRNLEEEAKLQFEKDLIKDKIEAQKKAKYDKWSKGLVQTQQRQEKIESDMHEMSKPLARYEGDVDLDKLLRDKEREDDPMLAMMRKNRVEEQRQEGTLKVMPKYKGPPPPLNRFSIGPGYRWDGVDRSNGFEKKHFDRIANKESTLEEAYRWSTQDM